MKTAGWLSMWSAFATERTRSNGPVGHKPRSFTVSSTVVHSPDTTSAILVWHYDSYLAQFFARFCVLTRHSTFSIDLTPWTVTMSRKKIAACTRYALQRHRQTAHAVEREQHVLTLLQIREQGILTR